MEVTIQQADLAFAAGRALGSVSAKSPLPLLSCVLLEADKGALRVTGTDLDVTTSVEVPCTVASPGRAAVSARHFHEVVRKMPKGPVTLAVRGSQCEVAYGDGKGWSRFPTQDAADFPRIPELKAEGGISLEGDVLARLAARTGYATSTEDTRPQLNGVLVQGTDQHVAFVATDGHRLARALRQGAFGGVGSATVIVPARALQMVSRTADEATSPVEMAIAQGKNQAGFTTRVGEYRVQILTRLLEGQYPNYEQVIPKDNPRELRVARGDLMDAVDLVASHADNVTRQVRFSIRKGRLGVSSTTPELGAGEQQLDAEYDGEDLDIGYNAGYLLDILRSIPTDQVAFRLKTALSAGLVEPVGALPEKGEELLCLIMPLRLPDAVS
ncbi:MAG TPA: DNA polymerase III subunit beta [Candidatus Eisenbacteria bacterium]|nr:DNA polymerase III subunit beta [Candidatus Eisenbacteria bacterium]